MKYILVTGASSGIGFAVTKALCNNHYHVLASVRTSDDAKKLKDQLGDAVSPLIFDVTDVESIKKAFLQAMELVGDCPFVGIINNAGIAVNGPLLHIDMDEMFKQFDVNVFGLLRVTQTFFPLLKRQESGFKGIKKIINMGSISGLFASPFVGPYCASKYAVEAITDSLRRELLIYDHLDVLVIEPGAIATPIWEKAKAEDDLKYAHTDYGPFLENKRKIIENTEKNAIAVENVSRQVLSMLQNKKPPVRKVIMKKAWMFSIVRRWIPARYIDQKIKKNLTKGVNFRAV